MDEETWQGTTPLARDGGETSRTPEPGKARARHYRCRAEELRAIADEVRLLETQRTLLSLAESYDHMASMLDQVLVP